MEPSDLNPTPSPDPNDVALESWLRQAEPPLPDGGFSTRVLAALPPRRSALRSVRLMACMLGALAGGGFAALKLQTAGGLGAFGGPWRRSMEAMNEALGTLASAPAVGGVLLAVAVALISSVYALRAEPRARH